MPIQDYCGVKENVVCARLLKYNSKDLICTIKGAVDFTFVLEEVRIIISTNKIYLCDTGFNEYRFEITKDTIHGVWLEEENMKLKLIDDGMITYLELTCEC